MNNFFLLQNDCFYLLGLFLSCSSLWTVFQSFLWFLYINTLRLKDRCFYKRASILLLIVGYMVMNLGFGVFGSISTGAVWCFPLYPVWSENTGLGPSLTVSYAESLPITSQNNRYHPRVCTVNLKLLHLVSKRGTIERYFTNIQFLTKLSMDLFTCIICINRWIAVFLSRL